MCVFSLFMIGEYFERSWSCYRLL